MTLNRCPRHVPSPHRMWNGQAQASRFRQPGTHSPAPESAQGSLPQQSSACARMYHWFVTLESETQGKNVCEVPMVRVENLPVSYEFHKISGI